MKKNLLYSAIILFAATSCNDLLEKSPSSSLPSSEAIASEKDLENAINGIYDIQAWAVGSYAGEFTLYADLCAGDFQSMSSVNHAGPMYRYQVDKNHRLAFDFYNVFYSSLARINSVLKSSEGLEGASVTNLTGELYAMRG